MQYKILLRFERAELLVYWDKQRMEWLYSVFCKILPGEDKVPLGFCVANTKGTGYGGLIC